MSRSQVQQLRSPALTSDKTAAMLAAVSRALLKDDTSPA